MTNQELVGRAMVAQINLDLPTRHKVAPGETFRFLQAHADGGARADLWLRCGQVELLDGDATIPMPASRVGAAGRRRARGAADTAAHTGQGDEALLAASEATEALYYPGAAGGDGAAEPDITITGPEGE